MGLIFTLLLTYGGLVASLINPFVGLLIYICFAILKPEALWYWSVPQGGGYSRIIFFGLFAGWLLRGTGSWRFSRATVSVLSLVLYLTWSAASAYGVANSTEAWASVEETLKIVLPFVVGLTLVRSMAQLRQIAWVIVLSQAFLAFEFNLSYYDGFNRLVTVGFAGMDDKTVAISMAVGAGLALSLVLTSRRLWAKGLALTAAMLMVHVPLFTLSRGGMLSLVVAAVVAFWLIPKRPVHFGTFAGLVVVGVLLAGPEVREQFWTSFADEQVRDESAQSRLVLWGQAWDTMLEHPVLGIGPRQWGPWSRERYDWDINKEVHNTWLQVGAEVGFVGVGALILFFVAVPLRLLPIARGRRADAMTEESEYGRMVIVGLAAFGVSSQFITVYGIELPFYVVLMGAGLLKVLGRQEVGVDPVVHPRSLGNVPVPAGHGAYSRPAYARPPSGQPGAQPQASRTAHVVKTGRHLRTSRPRS